jgi:phosphoglycerol transferase MdoB-like AlkP superfamily enzyme
MRFNPRAQSLFFLFLLFAAFSFLTRMVLFFKSIPDLDIDILLSGKIFAWGFLCDCVTFSYFSIPFVLYAILAPDKLFNFKPLARFVGFLVTYLLMFSPVAEYTFFAEFGSRFNFIAVDYLIYTNEVIRNIIESYPVYWIFVSIFILNVFVFRLIMKHLDRFMHGTTSLLQRIKNCWIFAFLPVFSFAFVDLSHTTISANNCANEVAANGLYNLFSAFRHNELDYEKFYVTEDKKLVLARLRELVRGRNDQLLSKNPDVIARSVKHDGLEKKLNVLVIVEESLSAEYMSAFGGTKGLTPNLDKLAGKSLFFTNTYATGTRTVRGLEAITLSIPPLPGSSLVKRPDNENLFSWGAVMKAKGYDNKYIYAGHGYFDNMNYFFSHNGFAIIDKAAFSSDEITFDNAWGVCDEDLFRKVVKEANKSYASGKPFFSMVMTTSNHRPFTYPDGKIDIPSHSGRDGGVKYADYAIGRFIEDARKQPWFQQTIFVIVADHCAGSARKYALPIKNYQIPLLIYAPSQIKPHKNDTLASQIDIAPTVLGLMNFNYLTKFIGSDIMIMDNSRQRAFISTYEKLGFIRGKKLLILEPKKGVSFYQFDRKDGNTTELKPQDGYLLDALGYYQGTNYMYKNKLNRYLQEPPNPRKITTSRFSSP